MSYVKPTKACVDACIGIDTVNDLASSQLDTKTLLELEHAPMSDPVINVGTGDLGGLSLNGDGGATTPSGGQHDTPKVSRGTMVVETVAALNFGAASIRVVTKSGVCKTITRIAAGTYFLPIGGLTSFHAVVTPQADDNTVTRLIQAAPAVSSSDAEAASPGVFITTWEEATLVSSNKGFTLTEFGFNVVVYGRRGDVFDPGEEGFPWQQSSRGGRARRRVPRSGVFFVKV
jgi:hypothetical protein